MIISTCFVVIVVSYLVIGFMIGLRAEGSRLKSWSRDIVWNSRGRVVMWTFFWLPILTLEMIRAIIRFIIKLTRKEQVKEKTA